MVYRATEEATECFTKFSNATEIRCMDSLMSQTPMRSAVHRNLASKTIVCSHGGGYPFFLNNFYETCYMTYHLTTLVEAFF